MAARRVIRQNGLIIVEGKVGKDNVAVVVVEKTQRASVAFGLNGKPIDYGSIRNNMSLRGAADYVKRVTEAGDKED